MNYECYFIKKDMHYFPFLFLEMVLSYFIFKFFSFYVLIWAKLMIYADLSKISDAPEMVIFNEGFSDFFIPTSLAHQLFKE